MFPRTQPGSPRIQPKLKIGATSDPLEQEADRLAEQVMRGPERGAARDGHAGAGHDHTAMVRRLCRECEDEQDEEQVRRKPVPGLAPRWTLRPDEQSLTSGGDPLPAPLRHFYETRFDHDFHDVRIHSGAAAETYNKSLHSYAFAYGNHIWIGAGQPVARTPLLAHELAHVVQQSATRRAAQPPRVRRAPDKYADLTIDQLRQLVGKGDKGAVEALQDRYAAMSNGQLARYARGDDVLAQTEYARRVIPAAEAEGQGGFSKDGMYDSLTKDIKANRATTGITRQEPHAVTPDVEVEGGTVGAARTDIPGLEGRAFVGQSKLAGGPGPNPKSSFPPETNVTTLPQTHAHAEQHIADQLEEALAKIPREQLKGRKVWMLIEQEVCSTCAQGTANLDTAAGVLKKLSLKYPELTFEIKNLQSSAVIVLKGTQTAATAAEAAGTPPSATAAGEEAKSVQVETKIEVTKSVRNADGTTVSEVEYHFGKSLEQVNSTAPPGTSVPERIAIKVTQNADGTFASVESLSGQPQAMVEALAQKTLSGAGEAAGATEGVATAAATTGRNASLLFKGLKIGGTAAFAIITAYQLYTATPKQRPRVLASAAGGLAGGALGTYAVCNLLLDIETAGWGLLICGLFAGGAGAYAGSKGAEAAYDEATATDLDRAYKKLGGKRQNEIGIFNFLVGRMGSDGCIDAAFVEEFMRAFPEGATGTETILIAAQLADAPIADVPRVGIVPSRKLGAPSSSAREVVCPACHGRSIQELTRQPATPGDVEALKAFPSCSSVSAQALAALRSAVKNLPPRPRVQAAHGPSQPSPPLDPNAHASPPGYKPPDQSSHSFPTVEQQLGTVCPNCHASNEGKSLWKDFGSGLGGGTSGQMSEETYKLLQQWAVKER